MMKWAGFGLLAAVLVACGPNTAEPTVPPADAPIRAASPTVLPFLPTDPADNFVGRSDPTAAALAAEGQPSVEPTDLFQPFPTEDSIPLTIRTADGVRLTAEFYSAPQRPAPAVVLMPGENGADADARALANGLVVRGFHVMLVHPRGMSPSGGQIDWRRTEEDVRAALQTLDTLPNIGGVSVLGGERSALGAALACRADARCSAAILWQPLPDETRMTLEEAGAGLGALPVYLITSEDRPVALAAAQLLSDFAGAATLATARQYTAADPAILDGLAEWLRAQGGG